MAYTNEIQYVEMATAGNATDFGDLSAGRNNCGTASDGTYGVWAGGYPTSNVIEYVTIATLSNTSDFGDLTEAKDAMVGVSGT